MWAARESATTSSGRAYSRSIRSRTRRSRARSCRCCVDGARGGTRVALVTELKEKEVNRHIYNPIKKRGQARLSALLAESDDIARRVAKCAVTDAAVRDFQFHISHGRSVAAGNAFPLLTDVIGQFLRFDSNQESIE